MDTTLTAARDRLRDVCSPHGRTERVPVAAADGRHLATEATARRTVPHYERAAMDGFAVRAADVAGATSDTPVELTLTDGDVGEGEAAQVHTGSPLPDGADTVVRVERTEQRDETVSIHREVPTGYDVAPAGEDMNEGESLLAAGHRLRPSDLALLRAAGYREIEVVDRPRVGVIPTGEELVPPETDPCPGEVIETNGLLVSRLVQRWGGTATYRDIVGDEIEALRGAVERDLDHDIVVTTGGSSVGERDRIGDVVSDLGEVLVHGVAIKPGHPVGFGVVDGTAVLMLPGYPVSCLVNAVQLLRPAVAWLAGTEPTLHSTRRARLVEPLTSKPEKRSFERVTLDAATAGDDGSDAGNETNDDKLPEARSVRKSGAGVLSGVALADGWVEIPEEREEVPAGEVVAVQEWER